MGQIVNSKSHFERKKLAYVNQIKINNLGCSICKYWDPNLIRFFDLDHINPTDKEECLSRMIKDKEYSMEDVIEECKKCRVLCRHCHIIHTDIQSKKG